jgi:hypothetical protein
MLFHYDPQNVGVLRLQTGGLCSKLDELAARLRDGSLDVADLRVDFERLYQPDALGLADAMKEHLPDHDPRLIFVDRVGDQRRVDLSDMRSIASPLEKVALVASVQLQTIASILRKLAASVPEQAAKTELEDRLHRVMAELSRS